MRTLLYRQAGLDVLKSHCTYNKSCECNANDLPLAPPSGQMIQARRRCDMSSLSSMSLSQFSSTGVRLDRPLKYL